jgi:hypothetical protein
MCQHTLFSSWIAGLLIFQSNDQRSDVLSESTLLIGLHPFDSIGNNKLIQVLTLIDGFNVCSAVGVRMNQGCSPIQTSLLYLYTTILGNRLSGY